MTDIEAIYKLVLRNLQVQNYAELLPEAQEAMLREVNCLLESPKLLEHQKKQLSLSWRLLEQCSPSFEKASKGY
ncbi:hypothetical protein [Laspinema olomoucense]|uniref:Uncharacterized protein n=1 Tax=Laspinema olomoucense D3b TaxID=2953688 RepID=A0ABT2N1D9_9CYAN|nr:hypothetical protein [Laspinema sp. D3b]MCT7976498.1 hypothetical protein [Laspinema sp. D3b]